ncbi:NAD(P)/FAD-dependent oxidoreductase [Muricoccus aerilatus]|uniref:NAD(P)/FAD-dependent oxidoreductase n=1 Tax=Muricoccus aerilatus TaxID=452982 RepID=UPI0005C167CD|nr:FAD-dependent oxidoreductase [Roseomonas aerilata]
MREAIRRVLIVGAGHSGGAHALALRELGFVGSITLVGHEAHAPYERPSLSKGILQGEERPLPLAEPWRWAEAFDLRLSTLATAIDRVAREVTLCDGRRLPYDALVLATGGRPRSLSVPCAAAVHRLSTLDEARELRGRMVGARSVIVIGGGVIGLEVAASLRAAGLSTTVLEAGPRLLGRNVPPDAAEWIAALHAQEGVAIRTGVAIRAVEGDEGGVTVRLEGGEVLEADLAVLGIGILPRTELAEAAGLPCRDGVLVDAGYASIDDPHVFAIGDVASREGVGRQETWFHAGGSARAAARALLGLPPEPADVPWFWSDQFGRTLRVAGAPMTADTVVPRGAAFSLHLRYGRIVGAAGLDSPRDFAIARRLIAAEARLDAGRAAEPGTDLRKAVAA